MFLQAPVRFHILAFVSVFATHFIAPALALAFGFTLRFSSHFTSSSPEADG